MVHCPVNFGKINCEFKMAELKMADVMKFFIGILCLLSSVRAAGIQTMDQSCVLSLVVPREKIKTSCTVDDKVKRRINTLETKINIYKQQVLELETRIHKERLLNNDKIMSLETMLSKVDKLEDLDKRISDLESMQERNVKGFSPKAKEYVYSNPFDEMTSDQSAVSQPDWRNVNKQPSKQTQKIDLLFELENMKKKINETGNIFVHKMEDVLRNVSEGVSLNKTGTNLEDIVDNEHGSAFGEITDKRNNHIQNDQPSKSGKISASSSKSNETDVSPGMKVTANTIPEGHNPLIAQLEDLMKREINAVLNDQMEKVISIVSKQQTVSEDFDDQVSHLSDQHLSDIKSLNDKMAGLELNTISISQTMNDFYSKLETLQKLPSRFEELEKNMTSGIVAKPDSSEEGKGKKFDRLADIFRKTLDHYRNESKASFAKLENQMSQDSSKIANIQGSISRNITTLIDQKISLLNQTVKRKLKDMEKLVTKIEEETVLFQIDSGTVERKLKSKISKVENEVKNVKENLEGLGFSQTMLQKKHSALKEKVESMEQSKDMEERIETLELEVKLSISSQWVKYPFTYEATRTACFGEQYIKRTKYKNARYVGVVLCNEDRYKIFLGQNLHEKFKNIGDEVGLGQDHCEYVGGNPNAIFKVSSPGPSFSPVKGFSRAHWGEETSFVDLDFLRPSPMWYECGVKIP